MSLLVRAAQLLLLALAPSLFTPAPKPPQSPALAGLLALVALGTFVVGAWRLRAWLRGKASLAAALLFSATVVAALACAQAFSGARAPLGRGVLYVAVPLWAALALTTIAIGQRFGARARTPWFVAAALVMAVGVALHVDARALLGSPEHMWWEALRRDGDDPTPLAALAQPLVRARRYADAAAVADRCLAIHPTSCLGPALRAELELHTRELDAALAHAGAAVNACPQRPAVHALYAEVLATRGELPGAEREVRRALDLGGDVGRLDYVRAIALERAQRYVEARAQAERAIAEGAGHDAELLAAALAIVAGEFDAAERRLAPLIAADASDVDALYDRALIADRRNDYNRARQGYLAVLQLDARHPSARYNLSALTFRAGATDEARHHAQEFLARFPDDPRRSQLASLVGLHP